MDVPRIPAAEVRKRLEEGAVLACAYDDEAKCRKMLVDGALTMDDLRGASAEILPDQEILFYCA